MEINPKDSISLILHLKFTFAYEFIKSFHIPRLYRTTVGPLLSGHPRDFENWPLNRGWPLNRVPEFNSSVTLVNSQLVCLLPVGIFNHVIFNLNYSFMKFNTPTAKGK